MTTGRTFGIAIIYVLMTSHAFGMAETEMSGTGSAMEGDVVSLNGTMIRLRGIDAPDPGQICRTMRGVQYDCFGAAKAQLQQMLDLGQVTCLAKEQDRSQHRIGVCRVLGGLPGAWQGPVGGDAGPWLGLRL